MKSLALRIAFRIVALLATLAGLIPAASIIYSYFHWDTHRQDQEAFMTADWIKAAIAFLAGLAVAYVFLRLSSPSRAQKEDVPKQNLLFEGNPMKPPTA